MDEHEVVRKGQAPAAQDRESFRARYHARFYDPRFRAEQAAIDRLEEIAWRNHCDARKAPITAKAGAGFADPEYDLSVEWRSTYDRLLAARQRQSDPASPSRALLICASPRNDGTCPGEVSKTWRLALIMQETLKGADCEVDFLDLSLLTSDYDRQIFPCKGCVSTAEPLCHWPCSCYPNHELGQVNDAMNEIYERWTLAHGIVLVTPVHWYMATSPLKLMMDRLVCADGGNADPTSTGGKDAAKAKALELKGWDYRKHLSGRIYGVLVHGDVAGFEATRRSLCDWLDWMGLIDAGQMAKLDRAIGYYEPYATSHATLDRDIDVQEEARNVARAVASGIAAKRRNVPLAPDAGLKRPRPK